MVLVLGDQKWAKITETYHQIEIITLKINIIIHKKFLPITLVISPQAPTGRNLRPPIYSNRGPCVIDRGWSAWLRRGMYFSGDAPSFAQMVESAEKRLFRT